MPSHYWNRRWQIGKKFATKNVQEMHSKTPGNVGNFVHESFSSKHHIYVQCGMERQSNNWELPRGLMMARSPFELWLISGKVTDFFIYDYVIRFYMRMASQHPTQFCTWYCVYWWLCTSMCYEICMQRNDLFQNPYTCSHGTCPCRDNWHHRHVVSVIQSYKLEPSYVPHVIRTH